MANKEILQKIAKEYMGAKTTEEIEAAVKLLIHML